MCNSTLVLINWFLFTGTIRNRELSSYRFILLASVNTLVFDIYVSKNNKIARKEKKLYMMQHLKISVCAGYFECTV